MSKPLPYRWLPGDHPETDSMNPEVRGCYHALLDSCWLKNGLPKDPSDLAVICRHLSSSEFEKDIWPKLKDLFYAEAGKYQSAFLDKQRRKAKKLSEDQRKRAKSGWENGKRKMPTVHLDEAEEIPEAESKILTNHWNEPPARREEAVSEPELCPDVNLQSDVNVCESDPMPTAIPIVAEKKLVSRETNSRDPYFDQLAAWEHFSELYPESYLRNNKDAENIFYSTVINEFWNKRMLRALDNFKAWLNGRGLEAQSFIFWFEEWQAWEDPVNENVAE